MIKTYNGEQKENAIALGEKIGPYAASKQLNISYNAIRRWMKESEEFHLKLINECKAKKTLSR